MTLKFKYYAVGKISCRVISTLYTINQLEVRFNDGTGDLGLIPVDTYSANDTINSITLDELPFEI